MDRSDEQQAPLGPLQQLVDDPLCAEIEVFAPNRVIATRRGRSHQEAVAFEHDGAVRGLVERLSGHPSAGQSSVTFELPGDMLARAPFPPITERVYLKIARPASRPERWTDLLDLDVLSDDVAQFLTEAVHARGTILVNGAPRSGRTTLLNVIAGEIAGDEPTAFIDDRRELTLQRRPGLVKLPLEFDDDGRERRLVESAVRADVARLVLNEVLDREIVDVFTAITSRRLSVLACAPPTESACEPRTLADTLLLLLRLEGLQPGTAVALVGAVAPLVVQTDRSAATERWRVARIFSISATGGSELLVRDLWQLDPTTNQLTRVPGAFTMRVHGASSRDVAVLTEAEGAAEAQRQSAASQPPQTDPFETSLESTRLLAEWIQSDVPLPIADSERDCALCEDFAQAVGELERPGPAADTTVHLARWRERFIGVCTPSYRGSRNTPRLERALPNSILQHSGRRQLHDPR